MKNRPGLIASAGLIGLTLSFAGCARLFGWDIHAPGLLSESFITQVSYCHERVALYLPPSVMKFQSKDRGGLSADPQTFHVGEAFAPMMIEALQDTFEEFIYLETEPTPEILKRYGISRLVVVKIKDFRNRVTMKGQTLVLETATLVLDPDLNVLVRYKSRGVSDAKAVFKKKGGPEVNLNAAIERNILAVIQYLQDGLFRRRLAARTTRTARLAR